MKQRDEDELERFLDRALTEYSGGLPRVGLEQRILANLAAQAQERTRRWMWITVPACAVLVVAMVLWWMQRKEVPAIPAAYGVLPSAPEVMKRSAPHLAAGKGPKPPQRRASEIARTEPRLPTFPSPPDESQARMLLRFVQRSPATAEQVVKEEEDFQKLAAEYTPTSANTEQEMERR